MTTMFNSLYYHIISRCSTYKSRPPPPLARPVMSALCFGSKNVKIYTLLCTQMLLLLGLPCAVTTADAPWLLLTAIWHFTSVCWALIVTHLIIKYNLHRVLSLHHLNPASLLFFFPAPPNRQSHSSVCSIVIRCSLHTLFSLRMAAVLDCQTHRRQNNSQNAWSAAIFPSRSGVVEWSQAICC